MNSNIASVRDYLLSLQQTICQTLENIDQQQSFLREPWQRADQGDGITQIMQCGAVFEQAAVNFSHVVGQTLPTAATLRHAALTQGSFVALGISVVIHPLNPHVPTTHANVRFFMTHTDTSQPVWWFGGGFDLTPYYPVEEDCQHWHRMAKKACDPFGDHLYPLFKKQCDDYFYLKHRQEMRGIGGLFFDDVVLGDFASSFAFIRSVGDHFLQGYIPIVMRRKDTPYGERERDFQCYRRGRYVEFNLLYDRGTLFGLQFGGRIESILASLPPEVKFRYNWSPQADTAESELYHYLQPREYI